VVRRPTKHAPRGRGARVAFSLLKYTLVRPFPDAFFRDFEMHGVAEAHPGIPSPRIEQISTLRSRALPELRHTDFSR